MTKPANKTIAQTTFRTHYSRYMSEASKGKSIIRIRDQAEQAFLVLCQKDDAPCATLKAVEAREKLSDVFAQVKAGVTFRVVNKRNEEVFMRPFRGYEYPLVEPVRNFWENKIAAQLHTAETAEKIADLEKVMRASNESLAENVEKIAKLVRHVVRQSHGLKTYTTEQLERDAEGDDAI